MHRLCAHCALHSERHQVRVKAKECAQRVEVPKFRFLSINSFSRGQFSIDHVYSFDQYCHLVERLDQKTNENLYFAIS